MISTYKVADGSEKQNSVKTEVAGGEKEASLKNNSVQCRLIIEENTVEEEKEKGQPNCLSDNNKAESEENASILRKIAKDLDLGLLRDNRYLAIILGRLRTLQYVLPGMSAAIL